MKCTNWLHTIHENQGRIINEWLIINQDYNCFNLLFTSLYYDILTYYILEEKYLCFTLVPDILLKTYLREIFKVYAHNTRIYLQILRNGQGRCPVLN